jgi:hypothetical protein
MFHGVRISLHLASGVAVLGNAELISMGYPGAFVPRFGTAIAQIESVSHRWIAVLNALVEL